MTTAKTVKTVKAAKAFKVMTGAALINTAITSIGKRGATLQADIHIAAVSVLNHCELHGDITLANKLIEAIPALARKNALKAWLEAFGKFTYDAETKAFKFDKSKITNMKGAIETPFWEFKPEAAYVAFDLSTEVTKLLNKASKAIEKGEKVPQAGINALQDVLNALTAPSSKKAA